jgi:hypothetical protein
MRQRSLGQTGQPPFLVYIKRKRLHVLSAVYIPLAGRLCCDALFFCCCCAHRGAAVLLQANHAYQGSLSVQHKQGTATQNYSNIYTGLQLTRTCNQLGLTRA